MASNVLCLFLYCLGIYTFKCVQSSQCQGGEVFGKEFFNKISQKDWKPFSDYLAYGYENCTASNSSFARDSGSSIFKWCFKNNKQCFVWNCSCSDDKSENTTLHTGETSLRSGSTSFKCSGNVIREDASQEHSTGQKNGDPNCDTTTTFAARHDLNNSQTDIKPSLTMPTVFMLGTIVGSVLTFFTIHLCRFRKRRKRVTDHSTFSDEIPLCDRKLKANQNEISHGNDEIRITPHYTEITENIHCDQLVSPAVICNGGYIEPVDRHLIRRRSSQSAVLDKESTDVYSHVYNHLNTNHDREVEACHHVKVTDHIYNVSITEKKEHHVSEKDAMDLQSALKEGDPTSIRRRSFDKPHEPKDCAGDVLSPISSCTTNLKMKNNKYEEVEKSEPVIQPDLIAKMDDEKAYFVLEKRNDDNLND